MSPLSHLSSLCNDPSSSSSIRKHSMFESLKNVFKILLENTWLARGFSLFLEILDPIFQKISNFIETVFRVVCVCFTCGKVGASTSTSKKKKKNEMGKKGSIDEKTGMISSTDSSSSSPTEIKNQETENSQQKKKQKNKNEFTSFKRRRILIEGRRVICLITNFFSILGLIYTLVIAEWQIKLASDVAFLQASNVTLAQAAWTRKPYAAEVLLNRQPVDFWERIFDSLVFRIEDFRGKLMRSDESMEIRGKKGDLVNDLVSTNTTSRPLFLQDNEDSATHLVENQIILFNNISLYQSQINDIIKITTSQNWILTFSSTIAIIFNLIYHKVEICIFKFDNSVSPDLTYINLRGFLKILLETLLLLFHPNVIYGKASLFEYPGLYFLMLLRILPFFRVVIFESLIFGNTKTETVATLNSMNFGCLNNESIRLIIRHYMDASAGRILTIVTLVNWILCAECLRIAEAQEAVIKSRWEWTDDGYKYSFIEMMWLVPITFITIGYGDCYPHTLYGRIFAIWIGFSGTIASALVVTLMTTKLTMTRRERLLHKVLNSDNIKKELKNKAAIVLQRTYRRHLKGYDVFRRPTVDQNSRPPAPDFGENNAQTTVISLNMDKTSTSENENLLNLNNSSHSRGDDVLVEIIHSDENDEKDQVQTTVFGNNTSNDVSKEEIPSSTDVPENTPQMLAIPQIQTTKVLEAITSFRKLRIQNKYMDDDMTDMVDLGIIQKHTHQQIKTLSGRIDTLEDKIDLILKKMN